MNEERLLGEVEDLLRSAPELAQLVRISNNDPSWLGRVSAVIAAWDMPKSILCRQAIGNIQSGNMVRAPLGARQLLGLLHEAQHSLRMKTLGPVSSAIDSGCVFDYFDEIRKLMEMAVEEVFFIDPYLDAEVVSRYLPHVGRGIRIRMLCREKLATLIPAVEAFSDQSGAQIEVRTGSGFHDRYLMIDARSCYQSGASFKDGARNSPTTLTQIVDAFTAVYETYSQIWDSAAVRFSR